MNNTGKTLVLFFLSPPRLSGYIIILISQSSYNNNAISYEEVSEIILSYIEVALYIEGKLINARNFVIARHKYNVELLSDFELMVVVGRRLQMEVITQERF